MKEKGSKYSNKPGFEVPENYFQDFEARMMARLAEDEKSFGDNPFTVPDGYFENFGERMAKKLEAPSKEVKVIPLFQRKTWSYIAGVAAVAAILFSSIIFGENGKITVEDLDITAVENYLFESLDWENPNEVPYPDYEITASANPNIDKEALFEYLNENIEEPALLLNED